MALLQLSSCKSAGDKQPVYKDASQPVSKRVDDLLSRMTPEEKFWQLYMIPGDLSDGKELYKHGIFGFQVSVKARGNGGQEQMLDYSGAGNAEETALLINEIQRYFTEETRLGIPVIPFDEALHGLVREGATVFPQAIGLAATWNTSLMEEVAASVAKEAGSRGIRQILSPVLDIARDVRWGRVEETYGEDPYLVSRMGVAFISAFERQGIVATPKHFIANSGDGGRDSYPVEFADRTMEEVYFVPYRAAFQEAGARSVMASYNSFDGRPCTANRRLLTDILRDEWGFDGVVISDAGATGGSNVLHFITATYPESTREALESGLDVIFQTSRDHYMLFFEAFKKGMVKMDAIDQAVRRVLTLKFELGLFENPYVDPAEAARWNGTVEHRALAEEAARESIVLLKNDNAILPLDKDIRSIALIGADAVEARLGGYSGPGNAPENILQGMKKIFPAPVQITYAKGCGREDVLLKVIPDSCLSYDDSGTTKPGVLGTYFNNPHLEGKAVLQRSDSQIDFSWTLFSPDPEKLPYDWYSVRWAAKLRAPASGTVQIGITGDDGYRLWLDGKLIIDNWRKQTHRTLTVPVKLEKGKMYDLKLEYYETSGNARIRLVWDQGVENPSEKEIAEAVALARKCDVAVIVAGIEEGEFRDRALLSLPGRQEELIRAVASTGKPVVVVLIGGSAVTMERWIGHASAIVQAWYPGEAGGSAVASVLSGAYNPAGRLPFTWPHHEGQLPLFYNHKPTGRGDDYMNLTGKPLFPFGYGLSYSTFSYSNLSISKTQFHPDESVEVACTVTNTGNSDGDEVVQLYVKDLYASVVRPVIELKGFKRIHLKAGTSAKVTFRLTPDHLAFPDIHMNRKTEPGTYRVMIGSSSIDIRLRGEILCVQ
ncbi:MAG TPA: glycoside hydrolase family 3 N-terminal domain-containing protein [Bacteroidales bacterium]|nr:glycoside hydrolase family 3 N-terminal domain-containing protein [Bacteroidales bacterium]